MTANANTKNAKSSRREYRGNLRRVEVSEEASRVPPHDLEAERYVVGAMLVSESALVEGISILRPEDFYSETYRILFAAFMAAAGDGVKVDAGTIRPYLGEHDRIEIQRLYETLPLSSNVGVVAKNVKALSTARAALDAATRIQEAALRYPDTDPVAVASKEIESLLLEEYDSGVTSYRESVGDFREIIERRQASEGVTGIRTGIAKMDSHFGGLNPGHSYLIAARPAMGKSLVVGQIALTAARQGYRVLLQTPEMSRMQYLDRLAHAAAGVDYELALRGGLSEDEVASVVEEAENIAALPLFADDAGVQTAGRVRANVMRYKPDLLIVDYLQYMASDDPRASREQQVAQVSRDLTALKSDFNIAVVIAAQLNRGVESRKNKRPSLADLRESGQLEQDGDAVVFLHRESRYTDKAPEDEIEFLCEKWRFGKLWKSVEYLQRGANWVIGTPHGGSRRPSPFTRIGDDGIGDDDENEGEVDFE